jgi:peptidyl-prolyl cis-trans isomerase B (cyclophilin B)
MSPLAALSALLLSLTLASPPSDAPDSFESIQRDLTQLHRYLLGRQGVGDEDRAELARLRSRLEAISQAQPEDPRGVAFDLQIAMWLGEEERVDDSFRRLVEMQPENRAIRRRWSEVLAQRNDWPGIVALRGDDGAAGEDQLEAARALMQLNAFEEAAARLAAIPAEQRSEPGVAGRLESLEGQIERRAAAWATEQEIRAREAEMNQPQVRLVTNRGEVVLELFEEQAPYTVANFITLVESGFYDGTRFHRVVPGFVAQGGDPNTRDGATGIPGNGGPGYTIPDEHTRSDRRRHFAGSLAMAKPGDPATPGRAKANAAGSQFYITVAQAENLDTDYTVFGRVLEGEAIVRSLRPEDRLESATVIRKRDREYTPIRLGGEAPAGG